jgi:hypothetical protein
MLKHTSSSACQPMTFSCKDDKFTNADAFNIVREISLMWCSDIETVARLIICVINNEIVALHLGSALRMIFLHKREMVMVATFADEGLVFKKWARTSRIAHAIIDGMVRGRIFCWWYVASILCTDNLVGAAAWSLSGTFSRWLRGTAPEPETTVTRSAAEHTASSLVSQVSQTPTPAPAEHANRPVLAARFSALNIFDIVLYASLISLRLISLGLYMLFRLYVARHLHLRLDFPLST